MMIRSVFFWTAILFATGAQAQVFKCVDANGRTVYSQNPCPSGAKSSVMSNKPALTPETPASKSTAEADAAFRKRQKERGESEKKTAEKEAQDKEAAENCSRARAQVAQLEATGRVSQYNEKGERYFLDDSQVTAEKARAAAMVSQWCK